MFFSFELRELVLWEYFIFDFFGLNVRLFWFLFYDLMGFDFVIICFWMISFGICFDVVCRARSFIMKEKRWSKKRKFKWFGHFEDISKDIWYLECFFKYSFQTPSEDAIEGNEEEIAQFIEQFFFEVLSKSHTKYISTSHSNTLQWCKYFSGSQMFVDFCIWIEWYFERKSKNLMWINHNIVVRTKEMNKNVLFLIYLWNKREKIKQISSNSFIDTIYQKHLMTS